MGRRRSQAARVATGSRNRGDRSMQGFLGGMPRFARLASTGPTPVDSGPERG